MTYKEVLSIAESSNGLELKGKYVDCIIEALKKQVARKPAIETEGLAFEYLVCPNCSSQNIYDSDCNKLNYCNRCGQKIDWSE